MNSYGNNIINGQGINHMNAIQNGVLEMTHGTGSSSGSNDSDRLELVVQTSPFEEKVTRNGLQKIIRVVIKNSPFNIQLKLKKSELDLNHVAFESTLLYDHDNSVEEKEVDFVKCKPVEHKATPSEQGDIVNVELRIKVLTSQHEDMFFRVKIEGLDPISKQPIKNLYCLSNPIKVISKPEQLKKKQPPKKRTWNDILLESVSKIQHQQNEQQKLIEKLLDYNLKTATPSNILSGTATLIANGGIGSTLLTPSPQNTTTTSSGSVNNNNNNNIISAMNPLNLSGTMTKTEFEDSFKMMMSAYTLLDPRQRAEKVRRVFRNASSRDSETLSELLDLFITEGVGGPLGTIAPLPVASQPNSNSNSNNNNHHHNNNNNNSSSNNITPNSYGSPHLISQNLPQLPHSTTTSTSNLNNSTNNQPNTVPNQNQPQQPPPNNPFLAHNNDGYPFFSSIPTSFDNEFNSFGSNSDFNPF